MCCMLESPSQFDCSSVNDVKTMWLLESVFPSTGLTNASGLAVAALSLSSSLCLSLTFACSHNKISLCTMHMLYGYSS